MLIKAEPMLVRCAQTRPVAKSFSITSTSRFWQSASIYVHLRIKYLYPQIQQILAEKPCAAVILDSGALGDPLSSLCFSHGFKTLELIA
jgi:hypothetical protein